MSKATDNPRRALGKGLTALLPNRTAPKTEAHAHEPAPHPPAHPAHPAPPVSRLPVDRIEPNPVQPRHIFEPERLQELAQSIKANGVIQPLVVRSVDGRYQLVAGERRWRAAKLAGLAEVPVVVQQVSDDHLLEITLIENIQREDLNPIETAQAFERLGRELSLSHEDIAQRTGKDRSTITNMLRLLRLPDPIQQMLADHKLTMGHARAILALPTAEQQCQVADKTLAQGLSVRQVEKLIQHLTAPPPPEKPETPAFEEDPNVKAAVQEMQRVLGTRVRITAKSPQRGRIEIEYFSAEELDRIYTMITNETR